MKNQFYFIFFIIISLIASGCARNPVTGKRQLSFISKKQEIAMGQQNDPAIVAQFGLYEDAKIQRFISQKGQQMAKISHRPKLNYEFKVLDSPVVNAFALPGGYVYFTRGILAHFNNEAEFAGVLGHEIGHITARHSVSQQSKQIFAQLGLVAGLVLSPEFGQYAQEASQGLGLLFLKFSRDDESQSDELGVSYSTKIGYDAHQMANFFKTLDRKSTASGSQRIPEFYSTHPDPANRFERVHELAAKAQKKSNFRNYKVNRSEYLNLIDGLIYGEDPKQGYVENNVFYHPELLFEFPVPNNWQVLNSPTQVQIAPQDGNAMTIFTLAAEKSLDEAANAIIGAQNMTLIDQRRSTVNVFPARILLTDQTNQQDGSVIRILTYLIQKDNVIYKFHGLALRANFNNYQNAFQRIMEGFRALKDPSKIDRQPERIRIKTVSQNGTFQQAMQSFNMPRNRHEELAILNGMLLTDRVTSGTQLKVIGE